METTHATGCTHALPKAGEYWDGEGGLYVGDISYDGGRTTQHLVFSVDESPSLDWAKYTVVTGAQSDLDGAANTRALIGSGHPHQAAQWADAYEKDGHADFFLPSRGEWALAASTAESGFSSETWYWTSTEYSEGDAWGENFAGVEPKHFYKVFDGNARAARKIAD